MAKQTIAYLKGKFREFMKPRAVDYADWLDSFVHKDDLETVNNTAIDLRINAYNTQLRSETPGAIDTLGDVLKAFAGFPDNWNLKTKIEAAGGQAVSWNTILNRPEVSVNWSEQTVTFSFPSSGVPLGQLGTAQSLKQSLNLAAGVKTVITDISVVPYVLGVAGGTIALNKIHSVTFGISPKVSLA